MSKRESADEQPVDLALWTTDGCATHVRRKLPEVSIGRTDSKLGLGFLVIFDGEMPKLTVSPTEITAFVLSREQVMALHAHLGRQVSRLSGPRRSKFDLAQDAAASRESLKQLRKAAKR
jgi:hypothetical protein